MGHKKLLRSEPAHFVLAQIGWRSTNIALIGGAAVLLLIPALAAGLMALMDTMRR